MSSGRLRLRAELEALGRRDGREKVSRDPDQGPTSRTVGPAEQSATEHEGPGHLPSPCPWREGCAGRNPDGTSRGSVYNS